MLDVRATKCDRCTCSGVTPHPSGGLRIKGEKAAQTPVSPLPPAIDDARTSPEAPARPDAATAQALVEHFPFGILELDADGCARSWNPAAASLLGDRLQPGVHCCDLFDCRSGDDGALAHVCLTELEPPDGATMPEIRVDLPGDDDVAGALWLSVAPLPAPSGGLVVQLRPGDRRDRRRRTDPHWLAGPRLRIRALGRTEVLADETALGGRWLAQRPGQMLKYLVSQRTRSVLLDEVAYALWPDSGYAAQSNVRHTMHRLRRRLEPARSNRAESTFIVTREGAYSLSRDHVLVDADEFEDLVRTGLAGARVRPAARPRAPRARARPLPRRLPRRRALRRVGARRARPPPRPRGARAPHARADRRAGERPRGRVPAPRAASPSSSRSTSTSSATCSPSACAAGAGPRRGAATTRCGAARCASSATSPASCSRTWPTRSAARTPAGPATAPSADRPG